MADDPFLSPPRERAQPVQPAHPTQPTAALPPAAPPPAQQPGYPPPAYTIPPPYAPLTKPKTWMNWLAFGLGLAAFVTCVTFIGAIIFGHLGLAAAKRGEADHKGVGIAGLVMGYVVLGGTIAYAAILSIAFSSSSGY